MILLAGCMFVCLNVVSGLFMSNDPCDLWPRYPGGIPKDPHFTMNVFVPSHCTNGTFRWDYPRGHVVVHFPNTNRIERKICFGDSLGGDIFTIVDPRSGLNLKVPRSGSNTQEKVCSKPTAARSILRIDAPSENFYMGEVTFEIINKRNEMFEQS